MKKVKGRDTDFWRNAGILSVLFLVMVLFNRLTPYISDDYTYMLRYPTDQKVTGLWDILVSQYNNYFLWSGRSLVLTLNQLFLWLPKWVYDLCNGAVFCFTCWLCARLAVGNRPVKPLVLAAAAGLLVHFNPCFGAVNLWICGSNGYLWPVMMGAVFLRPYRLAPEQTQPKGWPFTLGVCLAGLAAGWGNENTSGAVLLAGLLLVLLAKILHKKVYLWQWLGLACCLAGFLIMMLAPGMWVRMDSVGTDDRSPLTVLLIRIVNATNTLKLYGLWLVVAFGALWAALWFCKATLEERLFPALWFVTAIAANYALVLCPVYYVRSFTPVLFFLAMAILSCLEVLSRQKETALRLCLALGTGALCGVLAFDLVEGGYDIASYYTMRQVRDREIYAQLAQGQTQVETYAIYPYTRFCAAWGQPDLRLDPDNWVNTNAALHYGAESIRVTEQHWYPFPGYDDFSMTVDQEMSLSLE